MTPDERTETWAANLVGEACAEPVPPYGTSDWLALDQTDPRFLAAIIIAAECWRDYWTDHTCHQRNMNEAAVLRVVAGEDEAARFADLARSIQGLASVPTYAELCQLRGEANRAARARSDEIRLGLRPPDPDDAA